MSDNILEESLGTLSHLLFRHYGQKVILLIDEYDVSLDKAELGGYYDEMTKLIKNLLGQTLKTIRYEPDAAPRGFWINSSGNDIIRRFVQKATVSTRHEIEKLIDGQCVEKKINHELTYRELYRNIDNLWSVLLMTGYLTQRGKSDGGRYQLAIPNQESRQIFIDQILEWFQEEARKDTRKLDTFCEAFADGDGERVEKLFGEYLKKTISIRDTSVRKDKKENFYHGILLGLLSHREDWLIESNAESGQW